MDKYKNIIAVIFMTTGLTVPLQAQTYKLNEDSTKAAACNAGKLWNMDDCMHYAIMNSTNVKKKELAYSTAKMEKTAASTGFLPSISSSIGGQFNWGRNIDPKTNTYNNINTFNNDYNLRASMYIFDGGQIYNQWRQAIIANKQGKNDIQRAKDDKAFETMQAFIDVAYYEGCTKLALDKLNQSRQTLKKTERQEELGIKGKADIAQIKSQVAEDDYNLIHQQNLLNGAYLQLKTIMNMPSEETLQIDTTMRSFVPEAETQYTDQIVGYASNYNPAAIAARLNTKNYRMLYNISKGRLMPSISLSAGIYTNYAHASDNNSTSFREQFKNNRGEYVSATLSIPIFDNLARVSNMRKARNLWKIAEQEQIESIRKLETDVEKAVMDKNGYVKEIIQMEDKVSSDSWAYHVAHRKFEEGLLNAIDLQTTANTLLQSQVTLLQKRMLYILKDRLVSYYKGNTFINE